MPQKTSLIARLPFPGTLQLADFAQDKIALEGADAEDEERTLRRLSADYLLIQRHRSGAIEDEFEAAAHLDALNSAYPNGEGFIEADLALPFEKAIPRALYSKRTIPFDKRKYAEHLTARISEVAQIPVGLRSVVQSAIDLAEKRRKKFPRAPSAVTIDRRTRSKLLDLINRLDLVAGRSVDGR